MASYNQLKLVLNRFLEVQSSDPDDARQRRLLNIILILVGSMGLVAILLALILAVTRILPIQDVEAILIAAFSTMFGCVIIYFINRYRSGVIAGILFLLLVMLAIFFSDTPYELSNGRSLYLFVLPIIFSSFLLGSRSTFIFWILSSIELSIISEISGGQAYDPIFAFVTFFIVAFISWLSARSLEQTLRDLRSINIDLDKLVAERTHALAESLNREHIEAGRNQAILSSIADGVVVFNADNVVMLVNPALSDLTETSMQDLSGKRLDEFVQTKELSPAGRGMIMGLVEHPDKIEAGVRVEWGKKTLSVSIARVQDITTNENIGTVAVFRDITREAELEKMKETFVAIVSHELRTPLNAILGHVEMLIEPIFGSLNEQQSGIVDRVMVNARRLLVMVNDLLDEAQMKAGKLSIIKQPFKTSTLLENLHNTLDKISTDKGLSITTEIDPNMPETIEGDHQRLQQILINLVSNSIKFTEKGGIYIRILRLDKGHWTIEVTDTGSGIPEKEIPHIFETFRQVENTPTRRYGGFGLGLTIVKQLVELMEGEITVKSELEKGSTFTVTLPL